MQAQRRGGPLRVGANLSRYAVAVLRAFSSVAVLLAAFTLSGCGNDDGGDAASDEPQQTVTEEQTPEPETPTSEEPTEGPPAVTSRGLEDVEALKRTAFERGYSECSTTSIPRLAAKYQVPRNQAAVARAVGFDWARRLDETGSLGVDRAGRDGCLQALRQAG